MSKILIDEAVVRQALEALRENSLLVNGDDKSGGLVWCMDGYYADCFDIEAVNKQTDEAITALNRAIADAALDKMAENARELGLSYEQPAPEYCPECKTEVEKTAYAFGWYKGLESVREQPLPFGVGGGLVAIKTLLSRDPCAHANVAIKMIDAMLAEQPAPAQEPVADALIRKYINALVANNPDEAASATKSMVDYAYTTPPAPAPAQQCKYGNEPASCTSSPMDCQCVIDAAHEQPAPAQPWVGLTEFDIDQIPYSCSHADSRLIAYAIEAKLKEKNTKGGA